MKNKKLPVIDLTGFDFKDEKVKKKIEQYVATLLKSNPRISKEDVIKKVKAYLTKHENTRIRI